MNFFNYILDEQSHIIGHKNHIIQDIFKDHWLDFLASTPNIRPVVKEETSSLWFFFFWLLCL